MKPIDANSSTYIDFGINYYDKDPKFKMGNHVKTSKYKFFWQKVTHQIGLRKFLWLKKVKNTVPCTYFISDLNVNKFIETFYEKYLQKTNQNKLKK